MMDGLGLGLETEKAIKDFKKEELRQRREVLTAGEMSALECLNRDYSDLFSGLTILKSPQFDQQNSRKLLDLTKKKSDDFRESAEKKISDFVALKKQFTFIRSQLEGRENSALITTADKVIGVLSGRIWSIQVRLNNFIGHPIDYRTILTENLNLKEESLQNSSNRVENLTSKVVYDSFTKIMKEVRELFSDQLGKMGVSISKVKEAEEEKNQREEDLKTVEATDLNEMKEHLNSLKELSVDSLTEQKRQDLIAKQEDFRSAILDAQSSLMSLKLLIPYLLEAEKYLKPSYFYDKPNGSLDSINIAIMLDLHKVEKLRKKYHDELEHECKVFPEQIRLFEKQLGEADLLYKDIRQLTEELSGKVGWMQSLTRPLNNRLGRSVSKVEDPKNPVTPYPLPFLSTQIPESTEGMTHLEIVRKLVEITSEEWGFKSVVEMRNSEEAQDLSSENGVPNSCDAIEVTGL